eukprot:TRINITY_DN12700_c0_g1_i2.p1 TRINITY_DN12700_c0_g1~~TRINITY_DN12700_c0_g1_i2.p1  ORF type:complete len:207 (-),score=60.95 TRINITY_DN12700_c0_g1_i2:29-649(-)
MMPRKDQPSSPPCSPAAHSLDAESAAASPASTAPSASPPPAMARKTSSARAPSTPRPALAPASSTSPTSTSLGVEEAPPLAYLRRGRLVLRVDAATSCRLQRALKGTKVEKLSPHVIQRSDIPANVATFAVLLTGETGSGKTSILQVLVTELIAERSHERSVNTIVNELYLYFADVNMVLLLLDSGIAALWLSCFFLSPTFFPSAH